MSHLAPNTSSASSSSSTAAPGTPPTPIRVAESSTAPKTGARIRIRSIGGKDKNRKLAHNESEEDTEEQEDPPVPPTPQITNRIFIPSQHGKPIKDLESIHVPETPEIFFRSSSSSVLPSTSSPVQSPSHTFSFPQSQFEANVSNPSLSLEPSLVLETSFSPRVPAEHSPERPPLPQRESSLFGKHKMPKMSETYDEEPLDLDVSRKAELPYQSRDDEDDQATQPLQESVASQSDLGIRGGQSFPYGSNSSIFNRSDPRMRNTRPSMPSRMLMPPDDSDSDDGPQPSQEYGVVPERIILSDDDERTQPIESNNGGAAVLSSGEEEDF